MNLEQNLDIVIITWNRCIYLKRTLEYIFAPDSPIKSCDITIFDNHSVDGTADLIEQFQAKYPNIKHIVNKYNIGGNGNICRAMEYPTKKYFWILCDDDEYDWSNWSEIESALEQDYDAIMLEWKHEIPKENNEGYLLNNMAFLPSTIYKTELINGNVMYNAYTNIMYCFPHLALFAKIINEEKKIYIASKKIIEAGVNVHASVSVNPDIHFRARNFNLFTGYIVSAMMLKDKEKRARAMDCLFQGRSFFRSMLHMYYFFNCNIFNLSDIFLCVCWYQKILMLLAGISYLFLSGIRIIKKKDGLYLILLNKFKTYIWRWKPPLLPK